MKVLMINSVCGIGSTGRICVDAAQEFEKCGHTVKIAYGRVDSIPSNCKKYAVRIGNNNDLRLHAIRTRIFDEHGFGSKKATKKFLEWANDYDPEILWLHNIHGYYINIELLFQWIKTRPKLKVYWTLHDCWAFTGHCSHFTYAQCQKWKKGCSKCPEKNKYPKSIFWDNSKRNYQRKKEAFTGVHDLKIITPSQWLADLVKESFLREYPLEVRYNTIDTETFTKTDSDFRIKNNLLDKKIVLGVSSSWNERKGIEDFFELSKKLDDTYKIVLVGLDEKQLKRCSGNILGIQRTNSKKELAEIYTAADVFFNPTYEDTYPTVNLEAEACGTPVITYKTGGSPETLKKKESIVVEVGNLNKVVEILRDKI